MKKTVIAISYLSFVSLDSFTGEYQTSIGFGHQYGGVLGAKLSYQTESSQYYASLGLVGAAVGFQTTFSKNSKHGYGLVIGREEFQSEDGFLFATYDYHLNGLTHNGLVMGAGLGVTREDTGSFFADTGKTETSTSVTLNIGYKF